MSPSFGLAVSPRKGLPTAHPMTPASSRRSWLLSGSFVAVVLWLTEYYATNDDAVFGRFQTLAALRGSRGDCDTTTAAEVGAYYAPDPQIVWMLSFGGSVREYLG